MITNEQLSRHAQGFGGSDAKLFYKLGSQGLNSLSHTDCRRIRQALGREPLTEIPPTAAMQKGHDFEAWCLNVVPDDFRPEVEMEQPMAKSFATFAHADFLRANDEGVTVIECKCTQGDVDKTYNDYYAQLQWYFIMGADEVILWHHPSDLFDFTEDELSMETIDRNEDVIGIMRRGVKMLDEAISDGNFDEAPKEWTAEDLLPYEAEDANALVKACRRLKELEEQIETFKERLKRVMQENGVMSIDMDGMRITYVGESVGRTFDKKALAAAHPEIDLTQYEKTTKRSAYIKIQ